MMSERDKKYQDFFEDDMKNNRGRIVNNCEEIKFLLSNPREAEKITKNYLEGALSYATMFSEFYKDYKNYKSLYDFPIMDKVALKENWDKIAVSEYQNLSDTVRKYTSGSTGTPFCMVLDRFKHGRWIAANKVFRENVGVKSHEKTVFISETVADKKIPMERQERDNVYYLRDSYYDDQTMGKFLEFLKENNVRTVTAMASYLDGLVRYIAAGKAPVWEGEMIAIFTVSETLKEHTRKAISEYFSCPVYVLFANEECGVLAVEDEKGIGCRVNTADFFFEVLKLDCDEPEEDGKMGRLVITDYFNRAFPLIRYENGDLVTKKTMEDGTVYFTEISGRKIDMLYTTDGRPVHYFNGISFLEPYLDIKQFQLIQEDYHNFTWVLNTKNHDYEEMIVKECKELFGQDSNWKFEYVDEIPRLKSGKRRMTVQKMQL